MSYRVIESLNLPPDTQAENPPIIFEAVKPDGQLLVFAGTEHIGRLEQTNIAAADNPQMPVLRKTFTAFASNKPSDRKAVAIVEGQYHELAATPEQSLESGGEMRWAAHRATLHNIPVSYDPLYPEAEPLMDRFGPKNVMYYYWARQALQGIREGQSDMLGYLQGTLDKYHTAIGHLPKLQDFDFSNSNLLDIHTKLFTWDFNPQDGDFKTNITYARSRFEDHPISDVARACQYARDEFLMDKIATAWQAGKNILCFYYWRHYLAIDPALRKLLEDAKTSDNIRSAIGNAAFTVFKKSSVQASEDPLA